VKGLGPFYIATTSGGVSFVSEIHTISLVSDDSSGAMVPLLATRLPTLADESVQVFPDGRMQTTWQLHPHARWHDGQPFTADDFVFGWQVQTDPEVPLSRWPGLDRIERVEAVDAHTIRIDWTSTYYQALSIGVKAISPMPTHLLRETHASSKEAFLNLPYWTSDYVHFGAFRLVDFGLGESLIFERFESFFLGRPKVEQIRLHVIGDQNTLYANLLAGTVDIAPEATLSEELAFQLHEQWQGTRGGQVFHVPASLNFLAPQFNPAVAAPRELATDPQTRRGLFLGLDRDAIRDVLYPGLTGLEGDTLLLPGDPRRDIVGSPLARYRYDPRAAMQTFTQAGWQRDGAGRITRQNGEPVELAVRGTRGAGQKSAAIAADHWRQLGLTIKEELVPASLVLDLKYRVEYTGVEWTSKSTGDNTLQFFLTSQLPTPQNRYSGGNRGSYSNPVFDQLADRFYVTVDPTEQGRILKDIGELWAADFPILPVVFSLKLVAVRAGLHSLSEEYASWRARSAWAWSRE
jgi:peptide/nickel transport system substrate-binding protein